MAGRFCSFIGGLSVGTRSCVGRQERRSLGVQGLAWRCWRLVSGRRRSAKR